MQAVQACVSGEFSDYGTTKGHERYQRSRHPLSRTRVEYEGCEVGGCISSYRWHCTKTAAAVHDSEHPRSSETLAHGVHTFPRSSDSDTVQMPIDSSIENYKLVSSGESISDLRVLPAY